MKLNRLAAATVCVALVLGVMGCGSSSSTSPPAPSSSTRGKTTTTTTTAILTTPSRDAIGPVATLQRYWQEMASHEFSRAWTTFAPHALDTTEADWITGQRAMGLEAAHFSGDATIVGRDAIVEVRMLELNSGAYGCQRWSGTYDLQRIRSRWLITQANISPRRCPAITAPATTANQQPVETATSTASGLNCNAGGYSGTLVGDDVCQYDMGSSIVSGPAGAYLDGYFLESTDPCSGITHDADWSNGEQTQNTVQSYQQANGECG